ncbi:response regulator transcription factor [Streptomyces sp. TM32]|nr:response regulator transcription factor [Streptomyces sp. TM32]
MGAVQPWHGGCGRGQGGQERRWTPCQPEGSGRSMLDPATTARLMNRLRGEKSDAGSDADALSGLPLRREGLGLIGEGMTNRQIGKRLYLSEKTVKNPISRLVAKRGVEQRIQAAVLATQATAPPDADAGPHQS